MKHEITLDADELYKSIEDARKFGVINLTLTTKIETNSRNKKLEVSEICLSGTKVTDYIDNIFRFKLTTLEKK